MKIHFPSKQVLLVFWFLYQFASNAFWVHHQKISVIVCGYIVKCLMSAELLPSQFYSFLLVFSYPFWYAYFLGEIRRNAFHLFILKLEVFKIFNLLEVVFLFVCFERIVFEKNNFACWQWIVGGWESYCYCVWWLLYCIWSYLNVSWVVVFFAVETFVSTSFTLCFITFFDYLGLQELLNNLNSTFSKS